MPTRAPSICLHPGCGELVPGGGRCRTHAVQSVKERKERHGFFDSNWGRFRKLLMSCGNVICQRVDAEGRRCKRPVYFFHHILETAQHPAFALDWRNVVGVCVSCHPNPNDKDQGRFVPTLWRAPMSDEPLPEMRHAPDSLVPKDAELWDVKNRRALLVANKPDMGM